MPLAKSYFNVRQNKWYLTAEDAAKWTPGPCVVWEMTGQCPMGDKCTCAHLDRDVLNAKNQRNRIGNYVECTVSARCKYVLKQIKDGAWSFMQGLVRAEAPCLVELLQWLPAQQGGKIDVDMVQSFIVANKPVIEIAALSEEEELEAQDLLDNMLIECEEVEAEAFARTPAWAPNGDVPTENAVVEWEFDNFQQEEQSQQAFLIACQIFADWNDWVRLQQVNAQLEWMRAEERKMKSAMNYAAATRRNMVVVSSPLARVVPHDDCADYKWEGMDEEKKFGLM